MKKLKYLLFIIPLFFIFIGNSKAYTLLTINDTSIDENYIKSTILQYQPNFDFDTYNHVSCNVSTYVSCVFLTETQFNNLSLYSDYGTYIRYTVPIPPNKYILDIYADLSVWQSFSSNTILNLYYSGSTLSYTNYFLSSFTNKYGSEDYNVLNFNAPEPEPEEPTIEDKIYLPNELEEGNCPIILNQNVIRVYEQEPTLNTPVNYTDYFINSHYITQNGIETLSDTITCMNIEDFTTDYVYRFDFHQIIVIFLSIVIIISYPLMKIIHAFFVGFKRR